MKRILVLSALFLFTQLCGVALAQVPLYRYYNSGNGDHYYTTNYNTLGGGASGWLYESVQCNIFSNQISDSVPFYGYNAGGRHFYTTNFGELGAGGSGYAYEGVIGYVFASPRPGTVPLFRYYNHARRTHFYTTNPYEVGGLYLNPYYIPFLDPLGTGIDSLGNYEFVYVVSNPDLDLERVECYVMP